MSTPFYDLASLVLVPSGYKASKVYAQKPLTTDGQLAFTRSTTATRVGPDGLIEKVRTNLVLRSEELDNAAWTKSGVGTFTSAITTGFTDPTGGTDAQRWLATIASVSDRAFVRQLATLTNGIPYNVSFWVKSNTASSQDIYFMFQGGAVQATTATTSWQRISYSATTSTTSVLVGIEAKDLATDVLIYGFQLESGDIMTDYIPTTTAAVSVGMLANVPRLDYLGGGCPRLLLEPQRSNLVHFSESFNNAYWLNSGLSLSANSVTSPDGYVNADIATETATTSQHGLSSGVISFTSGTTYTFSAFAKNAPSSRGFIQLYGFQLGAAAANVFANFDLNTGVVGSLSGGTSTITNYGNGWYRCTFTFACGNSLSERINLFNVTSASATAGLTYAGDITKAIYWYGAQVEVGSYATSYIPTLGAAVTRSADAASKTGISALINSNQGVWYTEFSTVDADLKIMSITDNTPSNYVLFYTLSLGTMRAAIGVSGFGLVFAFDAPITPTNMNKFAIRWNNGNFSYYVNGVNVANGTGQPFASPTTLNALKFTNESNVFPFEGNVKEMIIFPTALSNSQLAELTA